MHVWRLSYTKRFIFSQKKIVKLILQIDVLIFKHDRKCNFFSFKKKENVIFKNSLQGGSFKKLAGQ